MSVPTGVITFFFTDIEGSTKLWEQFPEPMRHALLRHDTILRETIEANQGYVFKTMGDAFCAAFTSPLDAVSAACAAQRQLHAEAWGEIESLRVRMALHIGGAVERRSDYFGPTLNRIARLLAIGHGGQILLSEVAAQQTAEALPAEIGSRDLGLHRLKDLQEPEHVFQLLPLDLPADFPPLRSLNLRQHNLPIQSTSFVGRDSEIAEIHELLDSTPLLTLIGPGGAGKTRLAIQAAADEVEQFPEGVWLVELASLTDPALVPQAVATVLEQREEPGRPLLQTLIEYLRPRKTLLILDNCEHLIEACAQMAADIIRQCPQVKILATSRDLLNITPERPYRVLSLAFPPASDTPTSAPLAEIEPFEAVQLFVDRARRVLPSFALSDDDAPLAALICRRLDGIPLALELAAARVRALSLAQIAQRLDDRFRLLTGGRRDKLLRQQTLEETMNWSYDLLTEPERTLLCRLSTFAGGWTLDAAEAVAGGGNSGVGDQGPGDGQNDSAPTPGTRNLTPIESWQIADLLLSLVDKSLVVFEERAARYRLLETVRYYAQARLKDNAEKRALRNRHRRCYLTLAETAQPYLHGASSKEWLDRLESEHDNFRAALEDEPDDGEASVRLRLAATLGEFWTVRGYLEEGRRWLASALAPPEVASATQERAKALDFAGSLARTQGDIPAARRRYEEAMETWQSLEDRNGVAKAFGSLGHIAFELGDTAEAQTLYEESLKLYRELGDRRSSAYAIYCLGFCAKVRGELAEAYALYEESLHIYQEFDNLGAIARSLSALASVLRTQGDLDRARQLQAENLALRREQGHKIGIAEALLEMAKIAHEKKDFDDASACYAESQEIFRAAGDRWGIAETLCQQARLAFDRKDLAVSLILYRECLPRWLEIGSKMGLHETLHGMARLMPAKKEARLLGASQTLVEALEMTDMEDTPERKEALQRALGADELARIWAEGRALSIEQAVAEAMADA